MASSAASSPASRRNAAAEASSAAEKRRFSNLPSPNDASRLNSRDSRDLERGASRPPGFPPRVSDTSRRLDTDSSRSMSRLFSFSLDAFFSFFSFFAFFAFFASFPSRPSSPPPSTAAARLATSRATAARPPWSRISGMGASESCLARFLLPIACVDTRLMPSAARATPVRVRRIAKRAFVAKKVKQRRCLAATTDRSRAKSDSNKSALGVSKFAAGRANRDPEVFRGFAFVRKRKNRGCPLATRASLFRASRVGAPPLPSRPVGPRRSAPRSSGRPPERWDTRAGAETRDFVS